MFTGVADRVEPVGAAESAQPVAVGGASEATGVPRRDWRVELISRDFAEILRTGKGP